MSQQSLRHKLGQIGPGIAVAATGIGAGDMVAAAVAGARYGHAILWAAVLGAILKFALNDGIARWQLSTGTSIISGWIHKLGRWAGYYFGFYLIIWSFIVAGALIAACGLAGHALISQLSVAQWGIIHSLVALILIRNGRYANFEKWMKALIGAMFLVILVGAILVKPNITTLLSGIMFPKVPDGAAPFILAIVGGVGGSVTLLSYGYWLREKGWNGPTEHPVAVLDLSVAYILTGLFGIAIMVIAAGVDPKNATGQLLVLEIANQLGIVAGPLGEWAFLIGFWAAVFSSMLGVWQGVPYIFTDFIQTIRSKEDEPSIAVETKSRLYRAYLVYLAIPPMLLLLINRPVWVIVAYAVIGAFFMPFLAVTLLVMNNRSAWIGSLKNRWWTNALLAGALVLFVYLGISQL